MSEIAEARPARFRRQICEHPCESGISSSVMSWARGTIELCGISAEKNHERQACGVLMGGGSAPGSRPATSVADNLTAVAKKYPVSPGGYIGNGRRRGKVIQHHASDPDATAQDLFATLANGAQLVESNEGGRITALFPDKSKVVFRPTSGSDGSPAVEVYNPTGRTKLPPRQKIHLMKEVS